MRNDVLTPDHTGMRIHETTRVFSLDQGISVIEGGYVTKNIFYVAPTISNEYRGDRSEHRVGSTIGESAHTEPRSRVTA